MTRTIVFSALVGSHNYGLETPESDRDYKHFVLPTFDDLYDGTQYASSSVGDAQDDDTHDIRKVTSLWWKSNVNFVETLFSTDFQCDFERFPEIKVLLDAKERIAAMNLPYLFHACKGMFFNKSRYIEKGTSGTMHLVDKHGYDTKQALHAYRILDFLWRYKLTEDFKTAMTYATPEEREFMLTIKGGHYTLDDFRALAKTRYDHIISLESWYTSKTPDDAMKCDLEDAIKRLVRREITK